MGLVSAMRSHGMFTRRDILSCDCSLEQLQCSEGLIEGHFMAGLVDADETV
jgi:hypothetical protein